ncbi:MAG: hypothetical protein HY716_09195 [Planctomycetes bacterium]|nr:hypothetical protein [Planctomycetota bacterium]
MNIETDVDTFLAGEADRLRVVAFTPRLPSWKVWRGDLMPFAGTCASNARCW